MVLSPYIFIIGTQIFKKKKNLQIWANFKESYLEMNLGYNDSKYEEIKSDILAIVKLKER